MLFYRTKNNITMKRKFIIIGFCIFTSFNLAVNAQQKKDGGVSIGAKGGFNISRLKGDNSVRTEDRTAAVIGGFVNVSFLKILSVQPEILFSQRGGGIDIDNTTTSNLKLSYMEVPVLFKLRLPIDRTFFPHVFAGPDFAYRLNSKGTNMNDSDGSITDVDDDNIKKMDTGGVLGAGLDIQSRCIFFTVDWRYGFSFNDLGNSTHHLNVRHNYATVLAGIGFRFGGKK
jgi:hypothetical protein